MTQVSLKSGSRCSACSATSKKSGKSGKLLTRSGKLSKRVSRNVPEKGLEQQRKKRGSTDDLHAIVSAIPTFDQVNLTIAST